MPRSALRKRAPRSCICMRAIRRTAGPTRRRRPSLRFCKVIKQRSNVVVNITTGGAPTMSDRGARAAGRDLQAGSRLAQYGHDEFRALSDDPALQGQVQARLGGAVSRRIAQGHVQEHLCRYRIYPHHLRRERHPLRGRVLRHRPSLYAEAFPRSRRHQGADLRAIGVRHSRRHRRASGRRACRCGAPRIGCSATITTGRCWARAQTRCGSPPSPPRWAAMCASAWRIRSGSGRASWRRAMPRR